MDENNKMIRLKTTLESKSRLDILNNIKPRKFSVNVNGPLFAKNQEVEKIPVIDIKKSFITKIKDIENSADSSRVSIKQSSKNFLDRSKRKVTDKVLIKENNKLKSLLNNFIHEFNAHGSDLSMEIEGEKNEKFENIINSKKNLNPHYEIVINSTATNEYTPDNTQHNRRKSFDPTPILLPNSKKQKNFTQTNLINLKNCIQSKSPQKPNAIIDQIYSVTNSMENIDENVNLLKRGSVDMSDPPDFFRGLSRNSDHQFSSKKIKLVDLNIIPSKREMGDNSNNVNEAVETEVSLKKQKKPDAPRILESKKMVYDSFSEEEVENEDVLKKFYILLPDSMFKIVWDVVALFLIIYSVTVTPYYIAFELQDSYHFNGDILIDLFFLADVFLNFFTAYHNRDDVLIINHSRIVKHYSCSMWLMVDILCALPFSLVLFVFNSYTNINHKSLLVFNKLAKVHRITKWFRILRIIKVTRKGKMYNYLWKTLDLSILDSLKFLFSFCVMVHLTSCLWIYIGKYEISNNIPTNWISIYGFQDTNDFDTFIASIYFNLTTIFTTGYGDILPGNWIERLYLLFFMTLGSLIWSYVLSSLSHIFSIMDAKTQVLNDKMLILGDIRKEYELPEGIMEKVKKTLYHDYHQYKIDMIKFLDSLPGNLRNAIYINMYEWQISYLKFFENQSYDFIVSVLPLLKSMIHEKEDIILSIGDIVEEMYMVCRGALSVQIGYKYDYLEIAEIRESYHIGDILMYVNDQSPYDIVVKTKVAEILVLKKNDFAQLKLNFKTAIGQILLVSHKNYIKIEKHRKRVIKYYHDIEMHEKFPHKGFVSPLTHSTPMKRQRTNEEEVIDKKIKTITREMKEEVVLDHKLNKSTEGSHKSVPVLQRRQRKQSKLFHMIKEREFDEDIENSGKLSVSQLKSSKTKKSKFSQCEDNKTPTKLSIHIPNNDKVGEEDKQRNMNYSNYVYNIENNTNNNNIIFIKTLNIKYDYDPTAEISKQKVETLKINDNNTRQCHTPSNKIYPNASPEIIDSTEILKRHKSISPPNKTSHKMRFSQKLYNQSKEEQIEQSEINENFLNNLNDKIENNAFMFKNEEIVEEYLKGFIGEKNHESRFKALINKLSKLQTKIKTIHRNNATII